VCGSRAWARSRLGRVTPESAAYASLWRAFLENQSQPRNLLSESLYLLRDTFFKLLSLRVKIACEQFVLNYNIINKPLYK
jgi:hypothetical protein